MMKLSALHTPDVGRSGRLRRLCLGLLLAAFLPSCFLDRSGLPVEDIPRGNAADRSSAVFCQIEGWRTCSTAEDRRVGIDITRPYEDGFWIGYSNQVGLDYSAPCTDADGLTQPTAIYFRGPFPDGLRVCLNCGVFADGTYASPLDACLLYCERFSGGTPEYCRGATRLAPAASECTAGVCTLAGVSNDAYEDPRRMLPTATPTPSPTPTGTPIPAPTVEPVVWTDFVGTMAVGSQLVKVDATTGDNAGAASVQRITGVSGRVEFTIGDPASGVVCGLGVDNRDATASDIEYGLELPDTRQILIREPGRALIDTGLTFTRADTFRVDVAGTAVTYWFNGDVIHRTTMATMTRPLLVDATLITPGGTIDNALIAY